MDDQKGPVLEAKKSVTLFGVVPVAALAISGFCGLAPVAPVYAELKTVQPSSELSSGKFLLAQDAPLMPAPGAEAPKAADAPVDAPKPKKKKAAPAPDAAAPAPGAEAPKAADAPVDAPKPKKKKVAPAPDAAAPAPGAEAPKPKPKKALDDSGGAKSAEKKGAPVDRAGAEAQAKAAADKVRMKKQALKELKEKIKAEEKIEKEAEKAAKVAKDAACEGQLICSKAITGF